MTIPAHITTLVFDLGDTIFAMDPRNHGSVADWPYLIPIPGLEPALAALRARFKLVIASNAEDSGAEKMRIALARAGLDKYFTEIFTAKELGLRKPDPAFFRWIAGRLGAAPHELVMIGDSYAVDIPGARQAGWKTVWYNPKCLGAPGPLPLEDVNLLDMARLPQALERLDLPDALACQAWYLVQGSGGFLWQHVEMTGLVSYYLAIALRAAGQPADPVLAHRGGLLHDIAKISAKRTHTNHGDLGAAVLRELGQPELAEIAQRHMLFYLGDPEKGPRSWEEKIVHFADKICEGSQVVEWPERLHGLAKRYPGSIEAMRALTPAVEALQAELAGAAGLPSAGLVAHLRQAIYQ